eukprot:CAMPEP_0119320020 /NCGR_PEP_ID=MMETSP1333-20130426/51168_1 /TAXON_ID=418940 /ORGANISM="Scyphosphaera apsteinii, Strain RCC1455" /LENGTH=665 /DNA_ID=CAMNT_0007326609 /DNA_START=13 /DNA_END=2010 /DNA_ORIENTATION=+
MWIIDAVSVIIVTSLPTAVFAQGVRPVRGAPRSSWASYWEGGSVFHCKDASSSIRIEQLNDDYCDCPDGSDEPGTSACIYGHFYCANKGHLPQTLSASHVDDGICDCCDASDEQASGAGCMNDCKTVGAIARQAAEEEARKYAEGHVKALEWAVAGAQAKANWGAELLSLKEVLEEKKRIKLEIEEKKDAAEKIEREMQEEERKKREAEEEARKQREAEEAAAAFAAADAACVLEPDVEMICTADYAPVCARSVTYSNRCRATAAGLKSDDCTKLIADGECAREPIEAALPEPSAAVDSSDGADARASAGHAADVDTGAAVLETSEFAAAEAHADDNKQFDSKTFLAGVEQDLANADEEEQLERAALKAAGGSLHPTEAVEEQQVTSHAAAAADVSGGEQSASDSKPDAEAQGHPEEPLQGHSEELDHDESAAYDSPEFDGEGKPYDSLEGDEESPDDDHSKDIHPDDDDGYKYDEDAPDAQSASSYHPDTSLPTDPEAARLRDEYKAATDSLRDTQTRSDEIQKLLDTDFGPDHRFEALRADCFLFEPGGEWKYELCPFQHIKQKGTDGHSNIDLGKWQGFADSGHTEMRFAHGTPCWNGPVRSTVVSLHCAPENVILIVEEPEVCKYQMSFGTPVACTEEGNRLAQLAAQPASDADEPDHDEL